ncbi:MAG: hypothetical protein ACKVTZ_08635 [Bacteroidia bacterium]
MPRYEFLSQTVPPVEIALEWQKYVNKVRLFYDGELIDNQYDVSDYQEGLTFTTPEGKELVVQIRKGWVEGFNQVKVDVQGENATPQRKLDVLNLRFNTYWISGIGIMNVFIASLWLLQGFNYQVITTFIIASLEFGLLFWLKEIPNIRNQNLVLFAFLLDIVLSFAGITPRKWIKLGLLGYFLIRNYHSKTEEELPEDLANKIEQIGKSEE